MKRRGYKSLMRTVPLEGTVFAEEFIEALQKFGQANYLTDPFSDDGNPDEGQTVYRLGRKRNRLSRKDS